MNVPTTLAPPSSSGNAQGRYKNTSLRVLTALMLLLFIAVALREQWEQEQLARRHRTANSTNLSPPQVPKAEEVLETPVPTEQPSTPPPDPSTTSPSLPTNRSESQSLGVPREPTVSASAMKPPPEKYNSLKYWAERFVGQDPAGYGEGCKASLRSHNWTADFSFRFEDSSSTSNGGSDNDRNIVNSSTTNIEDNGVDQCLAIPRSSPSRRQRLRREIFAQMNLTREEMANASLWPAEYNTENGDPSSLSPRRSRYHFQKYKGIRLLAILGRQDFMEITARAIRRMLIPNGGVVCHVTIMCFWNQNQTVQKMILEEMKIPSELVSFQFWGPNVQFWDFTRLYKDVQDGYLHIKLDDDLYYISHDFDTILAHAFLFPRDHGHIKKCDLVSANIVNHHWLSSLHQQLGSINFLLDRPLKLGYHVKQTDYGFPAIWALIHRSFLRTIRNGAASNGSVTDTEDTRNLIEKFDFGMHDFNCDGRTRRWSINSFIFGWDTREVSRIDSHDEEYITKLATKGHKHRGKACAVGEAITVHSMFQQQLAPFVKGVENNTTELEAAKHRLNAMYKAIALHSDGVKPCCKSTGCLLFRDDDSNDAAPRQRTELDRTRAVADRKREQLHCGDFSLVNMSNSSDDVTQSNTRHFYDDMVRCTFPFVATSARASVQQYLTYVPPRKKKSKKGKLKQPEINNTTNTSS